MKDCVVQMEGDDSRVYNLMRSNDGGDICLDNHTEFANTQNTFQSKNAMRFRYRAFQWDPTNSEVRRINNND